MIAISPGGPWWGDWNLNTIFFRSDTYFRLRWTPQVRTERPVDANVDSIQYGSRWVADNDG